MGPIVAITHGHEAAWASTPGARSVMRSIGDSVDTVTYLGEYTRSRIAAALRPPAAARMRRLVPGWTPRHSIRGCGPRVRGCVSAWPVDASGGGVCVPADAAQGARTR